MTPLPDQTGPQPPKSSHIERSTMPVTTTDRWAQARKTIEDMRRVDGVPDSDRADGVVSTSEFSGHKSIYLANLEGFLGGRFPVLLAERDELALRLADAYAVLSKATVDEDTGELQEDPGGLLSALDHALTGSSGCLEPDEWQAERVAALAEHSERLLP